MECTRGAAGHGRCMCGQASPGRCTYVSGRLDEPVRSALPGLPPGPQRKQLTGKGDELPLHPHVREELLGNAKLLRSRLPDLR
jgi:hypothetical protein